MSYKVYADGALLYAPGNDDSTTLISPTLTREVNSAGSFEATVPPCNALVNSLSKLKTTIEVQQDGETIWRGRVLEDEKDFYNRRKIYCEGELSYLSDTAIPTFYHAQTYVYSKFVYEDTTISAFLAGCLAVHNALTDSDKHFQLGNVTVTSEKSKITFGDGNTYGTTLEVITNQLVDTYGGYLVVRYEGGTRYLDYLADLTDTSAQTIEFGENLLDFVDSTTAADTYTRLIPLGDYTEWAGESTNRRLTIALVDKADKPKEQLYVRDEAAENLFGVITHVELFDGVTDHNELYTKAKALLAENIYLSATYTVSAIDLKDAGADVERIKFGSKVRVVSKPHNVDMEVLCTALTEPLAQPDKKTYTLGKTVKTMTDRSVVVHKESSATANATTAAQNTADNGVNAASKAQSAADTAQKAADKAQEAADKAQSAADDAAKTATNYLDFSADSGLHVGYEGNTGGVDITGEGVKVSDESGHYVQLQSDGLHFSGIRCGLLKSFNTSGSSVSSTTTGSITISGLSNFTYVYVVCTSKTSIADGLFGTYNACGIVVPTDGRVVTAISTIYYEGDKSDLDIRPLWISGNKLCWNTGSSITRTVVTGSTMCVPVGVYGFM